MDFQLPIRFNLQYQAENAAEEQAAVASHAGEEKKVELASQVFPPDENDG